MINDERRKKRVRRNIKKTEKEMSEAVQRLVQEIDTEEKRKAAQAIIDKAIATLVK